MDFEESESVVICFHFSIFEPLETTQQMEMVYRTML